MSQLYETYFHSQVGYFRIIGTDDGIEELLFTDLEEPPHQNRPECLQACCVQLEEYFSGARTKFDVTLKPRGTAFQISVWEMLMTIPYGRTTTYLDIAKAIGNPKAIRAVGAANGQNRIPIIIPCHRVIGSNGNLIGFGGGIWRKEFLLKHEKALIV